MWVESDTNIPSGESLIRQFVRGKRWFREELGVDSRLAWMPDTFGFSAALPQIMKNCGVPYFATQKLTRQDPEADPFPYNVFWWEGMDGSRVLSHLFKKSNAVITPGDLITRWEDDRIQQEDIDGMIYTFGYGDGGGGPTREMVETARRCRDLEGAPRCRMESPVAYFERQENVKNTYSGELYLAWHRGTLTSQAKTKKLLRRAETALKQAEFCLSRQMLQGRAMPENWQEELDGLWKKLLFNQFHDVATGASIQAVHDRAVQELRQVADGCARLIAGMLGPEGGAAFNSLSWPVSRHGTVIPAQGWAALPPEPAGEKATVRRCQTDRGEVYELRNRHLACRVDGQGELVSIRDAGGREYLAGKGNRLLMFKDVNTCYDAWELGSMYENIPVELDKTAKVRVLPEDDGAALLVERVLHDSPMTQKIFLGNDALRLDFETRIDWQERHKLLKAAFPVNTYAAQAIHEIQFGYVRRPTHRSRQHDRDQYEVCNHRYTALTDGALGAAVLNDCKYGVSVSGSEIRLTLLKAAMMPDMHADRGIQEFTYSFCPFRGDFTDSEVLHQAAALNEPPIFGTAGWDSYPVCLPDSKNIIVDTVKPADTAENALLVRIYEAMGKQTDCAFALHPNIRKIIETDMLEENPRDTDPGHVRFRPFEIKTFILFL